MTNNKITFFIMSKSGARMRQFSFSRYTLLFATLFLLTLSVFSGLAVHDYYLLKKSAKDTCELEAEVAVKIQELEEKKKQIQAFAEEINTLKTSLVSLNEFEKKIRIIANLEKSSGQDGLFGVGGAVPDDLDSRLALGDAHNSLLRDMHDQAEQIEQASVIQGQSFESLLKDLKGHRNILAATPSIRPAKGWVTSPFGYRTSPFTGLRVFHKGVDIANRKGEPVIAPADGVVTFTGTKGDLGKCLIISHGHGLVTRYGHLNKFHVKKGAKVKRGDTVAEIGNTGRTTGTHLHYEVHLSGVPVNPSKYILN